jgi:hypothetical protein
MATAKNHNHHTTKAMLSFVALSVIYVLLVFLLPANKGTMQMYHLTPEAYHVLLSAITMPSLAVWLAAFLAYGKLYEYTDHIHSSMENTGFMRIARGIKWLAWSLPISSIVSLVAYAVMNATSGLHNSAVIINNYIVLALPLIGYSLIGSGGRALMAQAKLNFSVSDAQSIMLSFVGGGVLYCYLTFRQLSTISLSSTRNPYAMPVWLVVISLMIPYLYAWFVGILSALEINTYSKRVRGLLYRQPLRLLVIGLTIVIVSSIVVQFLGTAVPTTGHIVLDYHLTFRFLLRAASGVGFLLITFGVLRLKKIEEV